MKGLHFVYPLRCSCALVMCVVISSMQNANAADDLFTDSGQELTSFAGDLTNDVALGDLDGDMDLDAFVAQGGTGNAQANIIWTNDGQAAFSESAQSFTPDISHGVALGDLDGDTDLDAFFANDGPNRVLINQGFDQGGMEGEFGNSNQELGGADSRDVTLGDLDGDSDLDAVVANSSLSAEQIWWNDGSGTFSPGPTLSANTQTSGVALGDLDGDTYRDIVFAEAGTGAANQVWWNDMPVTNTFTPGPMLNAGSLALDVALAHLDDDGNLDIVFATDGADAVWWNNGDGTFEAGPSLATVSVFGFDLADVDDDGDQDAFLARWFNSPNLVLLNQGNRTFTDSGLELGNFNGREVALGDLDGDLKPDAFVANSGPNKVWLNRSAGPPPPLNPEGWQVQAVATRGVSGLYTSLALDANDMPHISFVEYIPGASLFLYQLKYARWDGVRWHVEFVNRANWIADPGGYTSIALDANGNPHIAYSAGGLNILNLKYANWDGAQWRIQTADNSNQVGDYVSLALDSGDSPHIAYYNESNWELMYTHWDGGAWRIEVADDSVQTGEFNGLVLDANDNPHISYYDEGNQAIMYAHHDGVSWQTQVVDDVNPDVFDSYTSIALDASGNPAIAYNWESGAAVKYAAWDGLSWEMETVVSDPFLFLDSKVNLAFDRDGDPHITYSPSKEGGLPGDQLDYAYRSGADWITATLDNNGDIGRYNAMALDSDGNPHVSYHDRTYEDLRYVTWGPRWETRTVDSGPARSPSVQVFNRVPSIGYYNQSGGQVNLARYDEMWDFFPADFVSAPVQYVSHAVGFNRGHISYHDADNQRLMYGSWDGVAWSPLAVDESGDVGRHNDLVLVGNSDGLPRIAYWDAAFNRVKVAVLTGLDPMPDLFLNTTGPALDADSGYPSITVLPQAKLGVSYHDAANGDLRYATLDPETGFWTDEWVDGGAGLNVGRLNDIQTDGTSGLPAIAYYDETNDAIKYATGQTGSWQLDTAVSSAGGIVSLALELGLDSRERARIAYTTAADELMMAVLNDGAWEFEFVHDGASGLGGVSLAMDGRAHLAYTDGGALQYAFRGATLDIGPTPAGEPPDFTSGYYYNPMHGCINWRDLIFDDDDDDDGGTARRRYSQKTVTPAANDESLDDLAVFNAWHRLFAPSPGGQFYINLYRQHGSEMGRIGLGDPALLWDAFGTLQNFMPGLEALVTGRGDEPLVTQEMVDDALDIWQRIAAVASPELASTINSELAKYNNLNDFVGMTFNEWSAALGVPIDTGVRGSESYR